MRFSSIITLGIAATAQADIINSLSKEGQSIATAVTASLANGYSSLTAEIGTALPTNGAGRSSVLSVLESAFTQASAMAATETGDIGSSARAAASSARSSLNALESSWSITPGNAQASPTGPTSGSPSGSTSSSGNFAAATAVPVALGGVIGMAAILL